MICIQSSYYISSCSIGPPSFPYTPGGDVCGIVVAVPDEDKKGEKCKFKVGDKIAARFANKPMGLLGEYALVNTDVCDVVPDGISPEGAAALVSSGMVGVILSDYIKEGDRVLIFGAGGGVGSHLCQMVKNQGASYVAGVSEDPKRLMESPLKCDYAIDYTKTNAFTDVKEWQENPFDVIFDLSGGVWPQLVKQKKSKSRSIIKPGNKGGRYLATTPGEYVVGIVCRVSCAHLMFMLLLPHCLLQYCRQSLVRITYCICNVQYIHCSKP